MKQSMGQTFQMNFIIIFFVVTFLFILAFISYMKSFRLNSGIAKSIEIHEGFNDLAKEDIAKYLTGYGYKVSTTKTPKCPVKNEKTAKNDGQNDFRYCIYEYEKNDDGYFKYGIVTYIYLDIPLVNEFLALPVYSETEKIYEFNV